MFIICGELALKDLWREHGLTAVVVILVTGVLMWLTGVF